jgi:hypothetical protein
MSTIDQILGHKPIHEDEPPVLTARTRPASVLRKQEPKDKEDKKLRDKARRNSVVAYITGMAESDEEGIIPGDAKRVDPFSTEQIPGMRETPNLDNASPSEPSLSNAHGEELIPPTAALVAPDVTPKVFQLIDPSQVPAPPRPTAASPGTPSITPQPSGADGALDTILGRENPSPGSPPPLVTAESFLQSVNPYEIKSKVAEKLVPAAAGGSAMPEHREGDGRTIFNVVRSLVG